MTVHYLPLPKPPLPPGQPCRVTFHSATSEDDQGNPKAIAVSVTADDGDYQGVIDAVAKEGGLYASSPEAGFFFLPWPCAYVEVHPLDNSAAVVVPIDPALSEGQGELQPQGRSEAGSS